MPRPVMHFANRARLLAFLLPFVLAPAARADDCDAARPAPAVASGGATTDALWRLAAGSPEVAPYDPATFVGPPVPLAILFAPQPASLGAGMRIQLEAPAVPVAASAHAPAPEPLVRFSDVASRLVPVERPDGTLIIELPGIVMVDLRAVRDANGVRLFEGDAAPAPAGGDR